MSTQTKSATVPKNLAIHQLTAAQLYPELKICSQANIVPYITGPPGLGKSALVKQLAKEANCKFIDIRLSTAMPEDLNGFPSKVQFICPVTGNTIEKSIFIPFNCFPIKGDPLPISEDGQKLLNDLLAERTQALSDLGAHLAEFKESNAYKDIMSKYEADKKAILEIHEMAGWVLLLDELPTASKALQAAAFKLILDKQVAEYDLHEMVRIFAAGNREEDNSGAMPLAKALTSRMAHFELKSDIDSWIDWALGEEINSKIISYLKSNNDNLMKFDAESADRTYPCPRTWAMLSNILDKSDPDIFKVPNYRIASVIGGTTAFDFLTFCKHYKDLPTFDSIIKDPMGAKLPTDGVAQYALTDMLATNQGITIDNLNNLVTYVGRLNTEVQANFTTLACRLNRHLLGGLGQPKTPLNALASSIMKKAASYA